jgi:hypothetical protein
MKKNLSWVFIFVMVAGLLPAFTSTLVPVAQAQAIRSNVGFLTPIEPPIAGSIPISNRAQLEAIKDNLSGNFHLTSDIDLGGAEWVPLGDNQTPFTGTFDGQGRIIRNMNITEHNGRSTFGLFGGQRTGNAWTSHGKIINIGLTGVNIDINLDVPADEFTYYMFFGGIAGVAHTVENCFVDGEISISVAGHGRGVQVGGLVGGKLGRARDSYSLVNIDVSFTGEMHTGSVSAGGITGGLLNQTHTSIANCFNTGNISVNIIGYGDRPRASASVAGIAGGGDLQLSVTNSFNTGDMTSFIQLTDTERTPPITGDFITNIQSLAAGITNSSSTVNNTYNFGNIKSHAISNATGVFIGNNWAVSSGIITDAGNNITNSAMLAENIESTHIINLIGRPSGNWTNFTNNYSVEGLTSDDDIDYTPVFLPRNAFTNINTWANQLGWDFDTVWMMSKTAPYLPMFRTQGWAYVPNWSNESFWYIQPPNACVATAQATAWSIFNNRSISANRNITTRTLFQHHFTLGANSAAADNENMIQATGLNSEQAVLNFIRDRILEGIPVVFRISNNARTTGHTVTAVGVSRAAIGRNTTRSDIVIINPSDGQSSNFAEYMSASHLANWLVNWQGDGIANRHRTMIPKAFAQSYMRDSGGRTVKFSSPVDVNIYSMSDNILVVSIISEEVVVDLLGVTVESLTKTVFLPNGEDFRIEIIPYDYGVVYYSITEHDDDLNAVRKIQFEDIPITPRMSLVGTISENPGDPLSSFALSVKEDGVQIRTEEPNAEFTGGDLYNFTLTVNANENGTSFHEGTIPVTLGDVFRLEAIPNEGFEFAGWYENGQLLSGSAIYRIGIDGNRNITPTFREASDYGDVPATGIPNIKGAMSAMIVFLTLSAVLWGYIIRRRLIK